jgi:dimethylaniline monooxygenase (N-oxide forming)
VTAWNPGRYAGHVKERDARVAVIGAGPGGLVAARYAIEAGFDTTVFEASDDLGGQWHTTASHSGVWPGMHTNTSRAMTAFSDFPAPADHPLHPAADQVHAYLRAYAGKFGVTDRIRFCTPVTNLRAGWEVDGESFDHVVIASGRFRKPSMPGMLRKFGGELIHAFDYPGAESFADRRTVVYGNGISGLEIASDLALNAPVVSAFRKSRYVVQKVVDGVSSDWQWYTLFGALERRFLSPEEWSRRQRERILRVAGNPADFGAPEPDPDLRTAGLSLCQGYLAQIREGAIRCRPVITAIDGNDVGFADGSTDTFEAIICATGYDLEIPYLDRDLWSRIGHGFGLYQRTLHPDLPSLGVIGQFLAQGPYWPLLELQARWIIATWTGEVTLPDKPTMRATIAKGQPPLDAHNALALTLAEELGVAPNPASWPEISEALTFGPLLPPRYRLSGPGAMANAADLFTQQLAASPRAPVDPADLDALPTLGLRDVLTTHS